MNDLPHPLPHLLTRDVYLTTAMITPGKSTPGPGAYDVESEAPSRLDNTTNFAAGAGRDDIYGVTNVPGPGQYDVGGSLHLPLAPSLTRGQRSDFTATDPSFPGPGKYEMRGKVAEGGVITAASTDFARGSSRADGLGPGALDKPGPGAYTPSSSDHGRIPIAFGTEARPAMSVHLSTPGPAAYDALPAYLSTQASEGTPFLGGGGVQHGDLAEPGATCTPGVGAYTVRGIVAEGGKLAPEKTAVGFTRSTRQASNASEGPGPGDYDPAVAKQGPGAGHVFGYERRLDPQHDQAADVPGPGAYEASELQPAAGVPRMAEGTRVTLLLNRSANIDKDVASFPGPGQYRYARRACRVLRSCRTGRGATGRVHRVTYLTVDHHYAARSTSWETLFGAPRWPRAAMRRGTTGLRRPAWGQGCLWLQGGRTRSRCCRRGMRGSWKDSTRQKPRGMTRRRQVAPGDRMV